MNPNGDAIAFFQCPCGETARVPLILGSGNDFHVDNPANWRIEVPTRDGGATIVRCPVHWSVTFA
ncbi:MAG: hypothetical protein VYA67_22040 [Actinomycetota bacterium]|nr:hypothetical protein [Actinomycetota bacterium]